MHIHLHATFVSTMVMGKKTTCATTCKNRTYKIKYYHCLEFTVRVNPHYSASKDNIVGLFANSNTIKEEPPSAESLRDADRLEKSPCSEVTARHWHTTKVLIYLKTTCQQRQAVPYPVTDPF